MSVGPATAITSRVISAVGANAFEDWATRFDGAARQAQGHRADVRLEQPGGLVHLICHFETQEHLATWEASGAFTSLSRDGDAFSIQHHQAATGDLVRFRLPSVPTRPAGRWC
ncbi:MAG: putative rane protein [Sphingomonas bacterium]|uniref:hypothetical protein n=1 Tax=Sphingomonas bacterium TaxID=1895847 RepID=UPI0026067129|nr:hypothetical protein [Sphingomonas bacterium]MDB5695229.1 putative rane protein [Sphingomonas bacterium]